MTRSILFGLTASILLTANALASNERLVTAGGGITEIVYALGMGDAVVGVDSSSVYPDAATKLPQVGYARMLSSEGLLSLKPTALIVSDEAGPDSTLDQIKSAGVQVFQLDSRYDVEATINRIKKVAEILGDEQKAVPVVASLRADLENAQRVVAQTMDRPKVLFIYARGGGVLNVSGTGTAANAMIELAGGVNAVTGYDGYKPLTAEAAVNANPDVILMTSRGIQEVGGIDGVLAHPGVALTPAAKSRRVAVMDDLYLLGFGPRLGRAVHDLCVELRSENRPVAVSRR
jgi:iron complex transport system substrate-binding protein